MTRYRPTPPKIKKKHPPPAHRRPVTITKPKPRIKTMKLKTPEDAPEDDEKDVDPLADPEPEDEPTKESATSGDPTATTTVWKAP